MGGVCCPVSLRGACRSFQLVGGRWVGESDMTIVCVAGMHEAVY